MGPLSALTLALGFTTPSAIGKETYPGCTGRRAVAHAQAQRYALIVSDYFIIYYSAAIAASYKDWLSAGVTLQLVHGTAKFSQAVWSGPSMGTDPANDSIANVDVSSPVDPDRGLRRQRAARFRSWRWGCRIARASTSWRTAR